MPLESPAIKRAEQTPEITDTAADSDASEGNTVTAGNLREGDFEVLSNLHGRHLISREELQCFRRYGSVEALYAKVYGNLPLSEQQFYLVFPVQHMIHCGF